MCVCLSFCAIRLLHRCHTAKCLPALLLPVQLLCAPENEAREERWRERRKREKKLFEVQRMVYNVCSGDVQALKVPQATGEKEKKKTKFKSDLFP